MVLSAEVRKGKLSQIRDSGKPEGQQKLHYRGETKLFPVHRIDLDYLIYNRHNGRLEVEILTWEQENAAAPETYDDELHVLLERLLWESSPPRNKATLDNIRSIGQQRPGIVSLDGVIIDGNRRAMLLRRLAGKHKQYFDAIILPDAYADNQAEIVRLETQYQLGEDSKVEYGPLQKYLHARRLNKDLGISVEEIDKLMGEPAGNARKLLGIMNLMDDYLEHIGCPRLYTMLKDKDGTKEGMFVDLYADLNRLIGQNPKVSWSFDPVLDLIELKLIQFDYMRLGDFADAKKVYREISHGGKQRNFFAKKELWERFKDSHQSEVDPVTQKMGPLEEFLREHPEFDSKVDAARHRDNIWSHEVSSSMKANFGRSSHKLGLDNEKLLPNEYLRRAKELLDRIDLNSSSVLENKENCELAMEINRMSFAIKKKFDRASTS